MKKLIIPFFFIGGLALAGFLYFRNPKQNEVKIKALDYSAYSLEKEVAKINRYTIYGTYLNISGNIILNKNNVKEVKFLLVNFAKKETEYNLLFQINSNSLIFNTSQYINDGINLENLKIDNYDALIKVIYDDSSSSYYLLDNKTNYNNTVYYTMTKDKSNNKIKISFIDDKINRMNINVTKTPLPSNVYDIVIDPGHGGEDVGTSGSGHYEKNITLDYGKTLKDVIEEELGFKVKLTREKDETLSNYGDNSRVVRVNNSKAKYVLSIHLNNISTKYFVGGIEVYAPSKAKLDFAKELVTNIVKETNTNYSNNKNYKVDEGVYVRNFNASDISDTIKDATKEGYAPYNITTDTPYYFIIRETGGINTNAYVDGRNIKRGENPYYLDNIGVEGYLLELGYMNSSNNMRSLLNDKEKYIKGIVNALKKQFIGE